MMTKEEREKRGLVGKKTLTDSKGNKSIIDFDDEESGTTFTYEEYMELMKKVKPGVKYYSKTTGELLREEELGPDDYPKG